MLHVENLCEFVHSFWVILPTNRPPKWQSAEKQSWWMLVAASYTVIISIEVWSSYADDVCSPTKSEQDLRALFGRYGNVVNFKYFA